MRRVSIAGTLICLSLLGFVACQDSTQTNGKTPSKSGKDSAEKEASNDSSDVEGNKGKKVSAEGAKTFGEFAKKCWGDDYDSKTGAIYKDVIKSKPDVKMTVNLEGLGEMKFGFSADTTATFNIYAPGKQKGMVMDMDMANVSMKPQLMQPFMEGMMENMSDMNIVSHWDKLFDDAAALAAFQDKYNDQACFIYPVTSMGMGGPKDAMYFKMEAVEDTFMPFIAIPKGNLDKFDDIKFDQVKLKLDMKMPDLKLPITIPGMPTKEVMKKVLKKVSTLTAEPQWKVSVSKKGSAINVGILMNVDFEPLKAAFDKEGVNMPDFPMPEMSAIINKDKKHYQGIKMKMEMPSIMNEPMIMNLERLK